MTAHPFLNFSEVRPLLLEYASEIAEEQIGIAMIFNIHASLKERAEDLIRDRVEEKRQVHTRAIEEAEREENRKFEGTPVTLETFLEWRDRFRQEMADAEKRRQEEATQGEQQKVKKAKEEVRLTGRQLWERGLVGKTADEEEDADNAL